MPWSAASSPCTRPNPAAMLAFQPPPADTASAACGLPEVPGLTPSMVVSP